MPYYPNKINHISVNQSLFDGNELVLSNANGISFGFLGNTLTASQNGLTTAAQSNHSHGNPQLNLTNLSGTTASNSNGLTLSLSAANPGGSINLSAGTTSNNLTNFIFSNSNGVSFGLNGSTVTATVQTNYLTTAALSNHSHGDPQLNLTNLSGTTASNSAGLTLSLSAANPGITNINVSAGTTSNNLSAISFNNGNGITFGLNASTLTASHNGLTSQSNQAVSANNGSYAFQTLSFSNANGVSFGTSAGSAITASHNALTTAAQSDHSHGNPQLNLTNLSGTTASNSAGFTLSLSAANASNSSLTLSDSATSILINRLAFTNLNGVTLTLSTTTGGSATLIGSHNALTTAALSNHSHGNPTLNLTNLSGTTASNSAGLTLSLSAAAPGITNANVSAGTTSNNLSNFVFSNSNGVSFGLNGSTITATVQTNYLTTAMQSNAATISNINLSAGTTSNNLSNFVFSNSNGVSFGLNGSTVTATVQTNYLTTAALSNHSHGNPQLNLTNLSGTTVSNSAGFTLSLSAQNPAGGAVNFSAGTTSGDLAAVTFNNANGISFGLNAGTITASHNGLTTAAASDHSHGNPTLALTNLDGTTASNSNGFTLSISNAVAPYTALTYHNRQLGASSHSTCGQNSIWLAPMRLVAPVSASTLLHMLSLTGTVSSNSTCTIGATADFALFKVTGTNASRFDTIWSSSMGFTFWNSGTASVSYSYNVTSSSSAGSNLITASIFGLRHLTMSVGSLLEPGLYAWGYRYSTSSAGGSVLLRTFNPVIDNPMAQGHGFLGSATNQTQGYVEGGRFSTTSGAMIASFELSEIRQTNNVMPFVKMGAI